jgi:hypothetical protein
MKNKIYNAIVGIINDTLKKKTDDGVLRWSRTSLTMFSSWIMTIGLALDHYRKNGFDYQVFLVFAGIAISTKLADSIGQRIANK